MTIPVYAEYIEHGSIPGGRAYVQLGRRRKQLCLCYTDGTGETFRHRQAMLQWLAETMPDALAYQFSDGVTRCAGTVGGMAAECGIVVEQAALPFS